MYIDVYDNKFENIVEYIKDHISRNKNLFEFLSDYFQKLLKNSKSGFVFVKDNDSIEYKGADFKDEVSEGGIKKKLLTGKDSFTVKDKGFQKTFILFPATNESKKAFLMIRSKKEFNNNEIQYLKIILENLISIFETLKNPLFNREMLKILISDEETYRGVFEYTGTGTIIINYEMLIVHTNQKFCQLTGYTKEEIENRMTWKMFVAPEDHDKMQRYHYGRRTNDKNVPEEYECRVVDKFDNLKYMYMKVGMIPGTDKSIASFMDITNRKQAETKLRQRESQLSIIVENFDGFIYIVNQNHEIEFINKGLEKRGTRHTAGKCFNFLHGFESPCPWCAMEQALKGEIVKEEIFSPYDNHWYSSVISPLIASSGKISKIQTILIDITERKLTEKKLKESAENFKKENIKLKSSIKERFKLGDIIGKSSRMQEVYELILRAAESNAHVIVYGESGTGKELVASEIHRLSSRSKENFVPVNCGAISEKLIESEFFGYKKGAFTGADSDKDGFLDKADKGTLFLDEIGDIGLNMQVKLLRAIDDAGYTPVGGIEVKKSDLRIIAATNKDLKELVKERNMREDFFYRIHVIPIKLPPLRERKDDIPLLAEHFISSMNLKDSPVLSGRIMDAFLKYSWPGNIRELQNVINRYIAIGDISPLDNELGQEDLFPEESIDFSKSLSGMVAEYEEKIIIKALEKNRWQKQKTAEFLGLHRKTLFQKIKKYGIE